MTAILVVMALGLGGLLGVVLMAVLIVARG